MRPERVPDAAPRWIARRPRVRREPAPPHARNWRCRNPRWFGKPSRRRSRPFAGLRPSRSGVALTLNFPNPGSDTSAPLAAAPTMSFKKSSTIDLALGFAYAMRLRELCDEFRCVHCRGSLRFDSRRLWHGPADMSLPRYWSTNAGLPRRLDSASSRSPMAAPCNEWRLS